MLPRATPSSQDVDASRIGAFVHAAAQTGIELHSLMVVRRGHVVAEGWWDPYKPDGVQLVYSLSKAFTSAAIGIAAGEGLINLDATVAEALGDSLPTDAAAWSATVRVRDLLTMSSGHEDDPINAMHSTARRGGDPLGTFLAMPAEQEPGLFTYNQGATLTLVAILTRATGEPLLDWLRPRLFEPLGIDDVTWTAMPGTRGPNGEPLAQGFTGIHVTTEAIATLGELLRRDGRWGEEQLIPAGYVDQARSPQVDNAGRASNPDWQHGYGFQLWASRHGYRGDGAFGQFIIVLPEQEAVIAMTAQTSRMQDQIDLVWEHLLPAFDAPDPSGGDAELDDFLQSQRLEPLANTRPAGDGLLDRDHGFLSPALFLGQVESLRVADGPSGLRMTWHTADRDYEVQVGNGEWVLDELPAPWSLHPQVALSGETSEDEIRIRVIYLESPHSLTVSIRRDGAAVSWRTLPLA